MSQNFVIFIQLQASEAWLRLQRAERNALTERNVGESLSKYPALRMRYFDAEAFSATCSDLIMIETGDLTQYYDFMETLRDSPIIATPYFKVVQIIPSIEDGFRAFEVRNSAA